MGVYDQVLWLPTMSTLRPKERFRDHFQSVQLLPFHSLWRTGSSALCEELVSLTLALWTVLGTLSSRDKLAPSRSGLVRVTRPLVEQVVFSREDEYLR